MDCAALELFPDEDKYEECKDLLIDVGFDHIEGFYYGNIKSNNYFSHNPEWMVNEAANFVGESVNRDKPFFLYFASTLTHSPDADVCALYIIIYAIYCIYCSLSAIRTVMYIYHI